MTQTVEEMALAIATALTPKAQAAIDALSECAIALEAVVETTPPIGSTRDNIEQAAKVLRNYAHRIAEPLTGLGLELNLGHFAPAAPQAQAPE